MAEIIGIRFKNMGKVYYFDPAGSSFQKGDHVVVETARGMECGEVVSPNPSTPPKFRAPAAV